MIASIKAEFRKLITVKSTYVLIALAIIYMIFYDFYVVGFEKGLRHSHVGGPQDPYFLMNEVTRAAGIAAPILFSSLIAVMLMAHEYRHNTIMYTLTLVNSRSKTLISKIIAMSTFALLFSIFIVILAPSLALVGFHFHHVVLAHQHFYISGFFWRVLFYCWSYSMIGLVLAVFLRNIVASVAAIFLLPVTIEPLIGLLLSPNQQQYLPFTALSNIINSETSKAAIQVLSAAKSVMVVIAYLIVVWIIAWIVFLRRDAS